MTALLQLHDVDARFGRVDALCNVNLRIAPGERVACIGSNGSGKSTLLRVIDGTIEPAAGSVQRTGLSRKVMVFQRPFMLRASALSNVALAMWIRGEQWTRARERAGEGLSRVGLADVAHRNAATLSAGQQQRLALARAWCLAPELLLLDEPTSSLDPHGKREVEALMAQFAEGGMTLVFASHNLGQVKRLATRVLYLERGRLLADLPVQDFFNGPRLREVSREAELFVKGEAG